MNTDIENRIVAAFIELILSDASVRAIVTDRVFKSGDSSHKAVYPSITIGIPSCYCFDARTGWYKATVNLVSEVHINDDKTLAVRDQLTGILRGIVQSGSLQNALNKTASARATATALTVLDSELVDSFEDEEANIRSRGLALSILARPSTGKNQG